MTLHFYEQFLKRGPHTSLHADRSTQAKLVSALSWAVSIKESEKNVYEAAVSPSKDLPLLPPFYGFKGGVARRELFRALTLSEGSTPPRDFDVFRFGASGSSEDNAVAEQFMPEDFRLGARLEVVRSVENYFTSRDLTVNEAALFGERLLFSPLGALDAAHRILRPSRVRRGTLHREPEISSRVLLKMLRFKALLGPSWQLRDLPDCRAVAPFDVALNLARIMERGEEPTKDFIGLLIDHEVIDAPESEFPAQLAGLLEQLTPHVPDGAHFFPALSITSTT